MALHQAGMMDDAENAYRLLLHQEPRNADGMALLGSVLSYKNQHQDAIALIKQALTIDAKAPLFHFHLGNAYEKSGDVVSAEASFTKATTYAPKWDAALYNLGNAQRKLGKPAFAKESYKKALQQSPRHIQCHNNLAQVYSELSDYPSAKTQLHMALKMEPANLELLFSAHDIALEHNDFLGAFDAAQRIARIKLGVPNGMDIIDYLESIPKLDTRDEQTRNCLLAVAASYFLTVDLQRASYVLRLINQHEPDLEEVQLMLGSVQLSRNNPELADCYYAQTFMMNPAQIDAPWNRSMSLLINGNLQEGFRRYGWRWSAMEKYKRMRLNVERWDGENPNGKTIAVQEEQGFGDTLQMLRFMPLLKERGANVLAYVRPELYSLLEGWDGPSQVVSWKADNKNVPPEVDCACGVMDLPGYLGITMNNLPANAPYIPNPKKGDAKYKLEGAGLKIGLVWSGNPAHKRNFARSYSPELLKDITAMQGFTFYGLQFKPEQKDMQTMKQYGVINLAQKINTLADSAATLAELDLLITVDSAPAHLAGALGLPVWTLLTVDADWRYLLGRADSPWYPTMRLFRQTVSGDWAPVLKQVQQSLLEFQNSKAIAA